MWEVETGKLVKTYTGTTDNVEAVAFSRTANASWPGRTSVVHLFDAETGKILHRFEEHVKLEGGKRTDYVYAVAFVDGRRALSGGGDDAFCGCGDCRGKGDRLDGRRDAFRAAHAAQRSKRPAPRRPLTLLRCVRGSDNSD